MPLVLWVNVCGKDIFSCKNKSWNPEPCKEKELRLYKKNSSARIFLPCSIHIRDHFIHSQILIHSRLAPGLGETYGNKARYMVRVGILTNKIQIRVSIRKTSIMKEPRKVLQVVFLQFFKVGAEWYSVCFH